MHGRARWPDAAPLPSLLLPLPLSLLYTTLPGRWKPLSIRPHNVLLLRADALLASLFSPCGFTVPQIHVGDIQLYPRQTSFDVRWVKKQTIQETMINPLARDLIENHGAPPPPRTKWTRRVPHPVLIGHAASLASY